MSIRLNNTNIANIRAKTANKGLILPILIPKNLAITDTRFQTMVKRFLISLKIRCKVSIQDNMHVSTCVLACVRIDTHVLVSVPLSTLMLYLCPCSGCYFVVFDAIPDKQASICDIYFLI